MPYYKFYTILPDKTSGPPDVLHRFKKFCESADVTQYEPSYNGGDTLSTAPAFYFECPHNSTKVGALLTREFGWRLGLAFKEIPPRDLSETL
jgi:hypothetical protein